MVLRKVKDQPTTVVTRTTEFVGNGDEHEERKEPYHRSVLAGQKKLTEAGESRKSSRVSGQIRVMQRPELMTTRRPAAATAAELGQGSSGARKKTKEREVAEGPSGRPIYKGELIKRA